MKIKIGNEIVILLEGEYIDIHGGRNDIPYVLDCSIMGVISMDRAKELLSIFTVLYEFPKYKMEPIQILSSGELFEFLFSTSDFPIVISC